MGHGSARCRRSPSGTYTGECIGRDRANRGPDRKAHQRSGARGSGQARQRDRAATAGPQSQGVGPCPGIAGQYPAGARGRIAGAQGHAWSAGLPEFPAGAEVAEGPSGAGRGHRRRHPRQQWRHGTLRAACPRIDQPGLTCLDDRTQAATAGSGRESGQPPGNRAGSPGAAGGRAAGPAAL